jgi:putative hemolysin
MPTGNGSLTDLIGILSILVLVAANGFFVSAEFSLVAVRRSRVAELVTDGFSADSILGIALSAT